MLQLSAVFKFYKDADKIKGWKGKKKESCTSISDETSGKHDNDIDMIILLGHVCPFVRKTSN